MTIFLCGFMGCGKTTSGKLVAKKLGCAYIDTDELIVKNEGMTIPEIFSKKGEAYFRRIEAETVKSLAGKRAVISCGGGALLNEETAAFASENGFVIFLDATFETCYERIKNDSNRPIATSSTKEELFERFKSRYDVYLKNSDAKVECSGSPIETAELIISSVKRGKYATI